MGRFVEQLQAILQRKFDKGLPRDEAFKEVRRRNERAIAEWYEHIDSILDRFGDSPPAEWGRVIDAVQEAIALEKVLLHDLDKLENSGWPTPQ